MSQHALVNVVVGQTLDIGIHADDDGLAVREVRLVAQGIMYGEEEAFGGFFAALDAVCNEVVVELGRS